MTSTPLLPKARKVWFDDDMLHVELSDGRTIGVPMAWFPELIDATEQQRSHWHFVGGGLAIHWDDIDTQVEVERLLS